MLNRQIQTIKEENPYFRVVVVGVGNELAGDDAAGLVAVRALQQYPVDHQRVLILETGPAPENFTAAITRFKPDGVLVVDAARLNYSPGQITWLELAEVSAAGAATHGLPLTMFGRYLVAETNCKFSILGIQIDQTGFDRPVSLPVQRGALRVASALSRVLSR